jgi:hypothetical protein
MNLITEPDTTGSTRRAQRGAGHKAVRAPVIFRSWLRTFCFCLFVEYMLLHTISSDRNLTNIRILNKAWIKIMMYEQIKWCYLPNALTVLTYGFSLVWCLHCCALSVLVCWRYVETRLRKGHTQPSLHNVIPVVNMDTEGWLSHLRPALKSHTCPLVSTTRHGFDRSKIKK